MQKLWDSQKPHGTSTKYRSGCRCEECKGWRKFASALYRASHRIKLIEYKREWRKRKREGKTR